MKYENCILLFPFLFAFLSFFSPKKKKSLKDFLVVLLMHEKQENKLNQIYLLFFSCSFVTKLFYDTTRPLQHRMEEKNVRSPS